MKKSTIFWIAIAIAAVVLFWPSKWPTLPSFPSLPSFNFGSTSDEGEVMENNGRLVDSLKQKIATETSLREGYEKQANELKDSINILKKELVQDHIQIQELRNENRKKVDNVAKLSRDELAKFVTNRYKDSISTRR